MMDGYFKGKEIELATPVPEYKFILPKDFVGEVAREILTFEDAARYKPTIAVYKRQVVTKKIAYYKFAFYE